MKKLTALFAILLCCMDYTNAQKSSSLHGLSLYTTADYIQLKNTFRGNISLGLSKSFGNHQIGAAALVQLYTNQAETKNNTPKVSGGGFDYLYAIPTSRKWLSLSFLADLDYQMYSSTWTANYFGERDAYVNVATSSLEHFISMTLGYGVDININEHIFIRKSIRAGMFRSFLSSGRNVGNESIASTTHDSAVMEILTGFGQLECQSAISFSQQYQSINIIRSL